MANLASSRSKSSSGSRRSAVKQQAHQKQAKGGATSRLGMQGVGHYLQALAASQPPSMIQRDPVFLEYQSRVGYSTAMNFMFSLAQQANSPYASDSVKTDTNKKAKVKTKENNNATAPKDVQAKLTMGQPSDKYEQEANQAANQVVANKPVQTLSKVPPQGLPQAVEVQKTKTEEESIQATGPKSQGERTRSQTDANFEKRLNQPAGGHPLSTPVQQEMGAKFGADFSQVKVHDNAQAKTDAASLSAKAFTKGDNIWLGQQASENDQALMGHELAHVMQQKSTEQQPVQKVADKEEPEQSESLQKIPLERLVVQKQVLHREEDGNSHEEKEESNIFTRGWNLFTGSLKKGASAIARNIPGYDMLAVILGHDPISKDPVERNTANIITGVIGLLPGGKILSQKLNETGAIERAGAWLGAKIDKLGITWERIKIQFSNANSLKSLEKAITAPIGRIKKLAVSVKDKMLEFAVEGALSLTGAAGGKVMALLKSAGQVFINIINDPIGFLGNLIGALKQGFVQFGANIGTHLKNGLMSLLFGALAGTGLQLPQKFDLKGILFLTLQVLNLTWANIRKLIMKAGKFSEKQMQRMEKTVGFIKDLITKGPIALWEMITSAVGNIKDMIIEKIRNWAVTQVIQSALAKLATLLVPGGAIVQVVKAIYDVVMVVIDKAKQLITLFIAITSSIGKIAAGALSAAAGFIESALASGLSLAFSFVARWLNLGSISKKIKGIIESIRKPINKGVNKAVKWVVKKASGVFGKRKKSGRKDKKDEKTAEITPETFIMSGQTHMLSFENGKVMMASRNKGWIVKKFEKVEIDVKADPNNSVWKGSSEAIKRGLDGLKRAVESTTSKLNTAKGAKTKDLKKINKAKGALGMLAANISKFANKYGLKDLTGIAAVKGDYKAKQVFVIFQRREWHDKQEYDRQLKAQQDGINGFSIDQWLANRKKYLKRKAETGSGRDPKSAISQKQARKELKGETILRLIKEAGSRGEKLSYADATKIVNTKYVALHDPDQVAGGEAAAITSLGRGDINSSIGAQWPYRINTIDIMVKQMFKKIPKLRRSTVKMNVKLSSKRR